MTFETVANHLSPFAYMLFGAWLTHRASIHKSPIPTITLPEFGKKAAPAEAKKGPPVRL